MSFMSLQRDDVLRTLRKKIEKGCDCAQVIDAKKLLYSSDTNILSNQSHCMMNVSQKEFSIYFYIIIYLF